MATLFEIGEIVSHPPAGKVLLKVNDDGSLVLVDSDGAEVPTIGVESVTGAGVNNDDPQNPVLIEATTLLPGVLSVFDKGVQPRFGADLTDASVTIAPGTLHIGASRLPPATLTQNRTLTAQNADAFNGLVYWVLCQDKSAFTYSIKNQAGTDLFVHGPNAAQAVLYRIYFTVDHWVLSDAYFVE